MDTFYRDAWAEIDLDAIGKNIQTFRRLLPVETKIMAVVKADGYGHGAYQVAMRALKEGVSYLGVAFLEEALELRQKGVTAPILILSAIPARGLALAVKNHITLTAYREDIVEAIIETAERLNEKVIIHIKLDTGMGRIGIKSVEELERVLTRAMSHPLIEVEGLFTHFSTADEEKVDYFENQQNKLNGFLELLKSKDIHIPIIHSSNSAAAMFYPEKSWHMIRLGISLYGQYPSEYMKETGIELMPAFQWKARLSHVKYVPIDTKISYGATFSTGRESIIATVPIGWADGYNRLLSNKGYVLVKGQRVPIVGRVCMDQFMVDVTDLGEVHPGDEVVLIGKQGDSEITVDEMASWLNTINYEVTCMVSKRITRVYYENEKIVSICNWILPEC
ncbi:MAG TPA: alanine racemase [Paenibacillaceae bacterium]|nr:alanine racemase [Paenibacillaceae bacterium]